MAHNPSFTSPSSAGTISERLVNHEAVSVPMCTPVYSDASGGFQKAFGSTGAATAVVTGLVLDLSIAAAATGSVLGAGLMTASAAQWDAVCGTSGGLAAGITYYLSATTPGLLTTSNASSVAVLIGLSTTSATLKTGGGGSTTIPAATIGGNNTGATGSLTGLTDLQAKAVLNIDVISVKDSAYGAKGDGTTDDTAAIVAAIAAVGSTKKLHFPNGTYKITNQGGSPARCITLTSQLNITADANATITFDSTLGHGIFISTGVTTVAVDGLKFQGAASDDTAVNIGYAIYAASTVVDVKLTRCYFNHVAPAFFTSATTSARLLFAENTIVDVANSVNPPPYFIIRDNFFHDTAVVATRSHSIYAFGRAEHGIISGNSFKNQGDSVVQIRANDAARFQKRCFQITDNHFENSYFYGLFISNLASEINIGTCVITGNIFKNVNGPMQLIGVRDSVISNNVIEWDYNYQGSKPSFGIALGTSFGTGGQSIARGNVISGNRIVNRHPYWAAATFVSTPAAGDTFTVGGQVYTWRVAAAVSGEVTISTDPDTCMKNLAHEIQGRGLTPANLVMRDLCDVWYSQNDTEGMMWVASRASFAFSKTGTGITVGAVVNNSTIINPGISITNSITTLLADNNIEGGPCIYLTDNAEPVVRGGIYSPGGLVGIISKGNALPVFDGLHYNWERTQAPSELSPDEVLISYDAFPTIRNCETLIDQGGGSSIFTLPWLMGSSGYVPVGDGKAKQFFYYGNEDDIGDPAGRDFHWEDGDQFFLSNGVSNFIFYFKRSSPSATQFNSYASLMVCINTQASGLFVASNPVVTFAGSDPLAYGYMEVKASVVGTARNDDFICISQPTQIGHRGPRTCGVQLRSWAAGARYADQTLCASYGGAATATKTFVMTPAASKNRGVSVSGVDATSQALAPVVYQADIIPGVGFTITHAVAAGTEKFFWRVNG